MPTYGTCRLCGRLGVYLTKNETCSRDVQAWKKFNDAAKRQGQEPIPLDAWWEEYGAPAVADAAWKELPRIDWPKPQEKTVMSKNTQTESTVTPDSPADDQDSNKVEKQEADETPPDPDTVMDDETAEMIEPETPNTDLDPDAEEPETLVLKFTGGDLKILKQWRKAAESDRRTVEDEIMTYLEAAGERISRLNRPYLSINDSLFRSRIPHDLGNHS